MGQGPTEKGQVLTTQIDSSYFSLTKDKEHRRAFYADSENPENSPVNIVFIETEILGKTIATRSLVPPLKDNPNPTLAEVIDICITNHLAHYKES